MRCNAVTGSATSNILIQEVHLFVYQEFRTTKKSIHLSQNHFETIVIKMQEIG